MKREVNKTVSGEFSRGCFSDYIREQVSFMLYLLPTVCLLFIWWLCDLPWQPAVYLLLVLAVLSSVLIYSDYSKYVKKRRMMELYASQAEAGIFFPEEESRGLEGAWAQLARGWQQKYEQEKENGREERERSSKYYTLWSHQIKTPVAAMHLLLQEEELDRRSMEQELWKAEQYVDMALQYQRLDKDGRDLVLKEYPLSSLVKKAVKNMASVLIYNKTAIHLEDMAAAVLTDEKWFLFVLEQLLGNAVKYTAKDGSGSIRIYTKESGGGAFLVVEDNGIGIRPEDIPRVFEWGYTGYNGRREKRSTGIGLFLCRRTMDMLGQTIAIESEEGKGTRVLLGISRNRFDIE